MRNFKFKLWDVKNKIMIHDAIQLKNDSILQRVNLEERSSDDVIWLQFTGLKDKNGVDIYEGDIVKDSEEIKIITWSNKCYSEKWGWEALSIDGENENYYYGGFYIVEVVGNIYENTELIK